MNTTQLPRRMLQGVDTRFAAIEAVGGLYIAAEDGDRDQFRRAVLDGEVRAIEVQTRDLSWLVGLPLDFLVLNVPAPDIAPVGTLPTLRGLTLDSWHGDLDFAQLPNLEWFSVVELGPGQLDGLYRLGHSTVSTLSIGRYRESDVTALAGLGRLKSLTIVDSRALTSLEGIEALTNLRVLDLSICPQLSGLNAIHGAAALQAVTLETCNRVSDLHPLALLPDLRVVQIEMRTLPGMGPLAGHPSLEFVWLIGGRPTPEDVEALLADSQLKMVNAGREVWMRRNNGWTHVPDLYAMAPPDDEHHTRLVAELSAWKYQ